MARQLYARPAFSLLRAFANAASYVAYVSYHLSCHEYRMCIVSNPRNMSVWRYFHAGSSGFGHGAGTRPIALVAVSTPYLISSTSCVCEECMCVYCMEVYVKCMRDECACARVLVCVHVNMCVCVRVRARVRARACVCLCVIRPVFARTCHHEDRRWRTSRTPAHAPWIAGLD